MTRINVDGENARDGLMTLVVTIVELLVDAMEREAIRRMESEMLTDKEVERLGAQLASLEAEIDRLKTDEGIDGPVDDLRGELNGLVNDLVHQVDDPRQSHPGYSLFKNE